jgi:cytochrome P450
MEASIASLPPGPRLPRIVQTAGFIFTPIRWIEANRRRYGDMVTFSTAFDSGFVMVFDPDLIKQVFRASPEQLRAGEANAVLEPVLGRRSVLLLDGDEHLRERKLMLPPFHGQRLKTYEAVMERATDDAIDGWPVGEPFTLIESMQSLTLDVIMATIFGLEEGARRDELKRRVRATIDPVGRRVGGFLLMILRQRLGDRRAMREFAERKLAMDALIYEEIAARRDAPDLENRDDVLSLLLLARDEDGEPMSDGELRDELVTLLVAGHETTATGLAWTFDLLLHNRAVLARLRDELDGEGEGEEYLDAVVKESLRVRSVVPGVGRVVRGEPFELGGYVIPTGVEINPSIAVTHRRGDRYRAPLEFRPERFLGPDAPDTYTWIPFGGGTRRCLGASFALQEMRLVTRRILARTELVAQDPRPERMLRRGITQVPRNGVRVVQPLAPTPREEATTCASASSVPEESAETQPVRH